MDPRIILLDVLIPGEKTPTCAPAVWGQLRVASANVLTLAPEEWRQTPAANGVSAGAGLMVPGKTARLSADFAAEGLDVVLGGWATGP